MSALEDLQKLDEKVEYVLNLLNQAAQALEEVHAYAEHYQAEHANPRPLVEAIHDIRTEVDKVTNQHNQLQGEIRAAEHEAEEAANNP